MSRLRGWEIVIVYAQSVVGGTNSVVKYSRRPDSAKPWGSPKEFDDPPRRLAALGGTGTGPDRRHRPESRRVGATHRAKSFTCRRVIPTTQQAGRSFRNGAERNRRHMSETLVI